MLWKRLTPTVIHILVSPILKFINKKKPRKLRQLKIKFVIKRSFQNFNLIVVRSDRTNSHTNEQIFIVCIATNHTVHILLTQLLKYAWWSFNLMFLWLRRQLYCRRLQMVFVENLVKILSPFFDEYTYFSSNEYTQNSIYISNILFISTTILNAVLLN